MLIKDFGNEKITAKVLHKCLKVPRAKQTCYPSLKPI